jgi:multidrug efflux pump subunit AcrA (membrane-fusion protein)
MFLRLVPLLVVLCGPALAEDYACLIEPKQVLKLAAPVQGVVTSVTVDRGDRVKKGQLLAKLDSEVEEANVLIAHLRATNDTEIAGGEAKLEFLKRKLARKDRLRDNDYGSQAQLEEAQSDERVAEAQLREYVLNFNQAKLEALRADGLLHILTIAEMDPLRVETFLPVSVYGHVKVGDVADVMPDPPVGGSYQAKVIVVDQVFDAASNTIGVRLALPNPDLKLPAGIHCRVRFGEAP